MNRISFATLLIVLPVVLLFGILLPAYLIQYVALVFFAKEYGLLNCIILWILLSTIASLFTKK